MINNDPLTKGQAVKVVKSALHGLERKHTISIKQALLVSNLRRLLSTINQLPWPVEEIQNEKEKKQLAKIGGPVIDELFDPRELDKPDPIPKLKKRSLNDLKRPIKKKGRKRRRFVEEASFIGSDSLEELPPRPRWPRGYRTLEI